MQNKIIEIKKTTKVKFNNQRLLNGEEQISVQKSVKNSNLTENSVTTILNTIGHYQKLDLENGFYVLSVILTKSGLEKIGLNLHKIIGNRFSFVKPNIKNVNNNYDYINIPLVEDQRLVLKEIISKYPELKDALGFHNPALQSKLEWITEQQSRKSPMKNRYFKYFTHVPYNERIEQGVCTLNELHGFYDKKSELNSILLNATKNDYKKFHNYTFMFLGVISREETILGSISTAIVEHNERYIKNWQEIQRIKKCIDQIVGVLYGDSLHVEWPLSNVKSIDPRVFADQEIFKILINFMIEGVEPEWIDNLINLYGKTKDKNIKDLIYEGLKNPQVDLSGLNLQNKLFSVNLLNSRKKPLIRIFHVAWQLIGTALILPTRLISVTFNKLANYLSDKLSEWIPPLDDFKKLENSLIASFSAVMTIGITMFLVGTGSIELHPILLLIAFSGFLLPLVLLLINFISYLISALINLTSGLLDRLICRTNPLARYLVGNFEKVKILKLSKYKEQGYENKKYSM